MERRQSKVVLLRARVGRPVGAQFRADEQTALARTSQTQTRGLQARISLITKNVKAALDFRKHRTCLHRLLNVCRI